MPRKLRVEYRTEDSFRREYAQNIAKGGLFIPTKHELEVREPVEVELVLAFRDETVVLPGETVHCIPPEMAETGAQPGVAIQFLMSGEELRSKLAAFAPVASTLDERIQGTGRRVAPRSRARVPVRLRIGGKTLEGHSRNLSGSGLLVALAGPAPAIGKSVEMQIDHPSNNETLAMPGKVARHVEAAGTTCVGIQLVVPEAREQEVLEFIEGIRAIEHSRRLGGINGPIADLGIRNVLTMFGNTAPVGMLALTRGSEEGYITIENGELRAQLGSLCGREALDRMLDWTDGSFEFEALVDDGLVDGERIPVSDLGGAPAMPGAAASEPLPEVERDEVVEEGATEDGPLTLMDLDELDLGEDPAEPDLELDGPEIEIEDDDEPEDEEEEAVFEFELDDDELGDLSEDVEPGLAVDAAPIAPEATLCAVPGAADGEDLSKTEQAVLDLAAASMTVAQAVDIIPEADVEVYAAVQSLLDQGMLSLD